MRYEYEKERLPKTKRNKEGWSIRTITRYLDDDIIEISTQGTFSNKQRYKLQKDFGKRIKKLRKQCGLTQIELAKRYNVCRSHISEIENGKHNTSLKEIISLAKTFNIYVHELLEFSLKNIIEKRDSIEEENTQKKLGLKIKQLRKANNMRQIDLAKKSCLQRSYISMIEKGKENISLWNIGKIAKTFKLYIHLLMKFD